MFGEDVVLVDAQSGQVVKVLSLGEGEVCGYDMTP